MALFGFFRRKTSDIKLSEVVQFYPSYGHTENGGASWTLRVQGCISEASSNSFRRRATLAIVRRAMRVDHQTASDFFNERMKLFLVDNERGKRISVRLGDEIYEIGRSETAGLFRGEVELSAAEIERLTEGGHVEDNWISYEAVIPEGDDRRFAGVVQLIGPTGLSIISDIDDTLKHSNVPNRRDLFRNTFLRAYKPIDGMAELYRRCADQGVVFHYVSGSPWQLYQPLSELWGVQGFPVGSFHMKLFRLKDTPRLRRKSPQQSYKQRSVEPILQAFPQRRFVLIGDSGEEDPEIYGKVARAFPEQIVGCFIRNVAGEDPESRRFLTAFADVPRERWTVYDDPSEIEVPVLELVRGYNVSV